MFGFSRGLCRPGPFAARATVSTLLTDSTGAPANDLVLDFIAEAVELSGTLSVRAGLRILAIERIGRADG